MTQPQTLNVEYSELMARADELEQSLPAMPLTNPQAPSELSYARDAAKQLALNADMIRLYLNGCGREWKSLATALRTAAKAYEEVDEGAADAIANEGDATAGATAPSALGDSDMPFTPPSPLTLPPLVQDAYYEVRVAARDIEAGDHGAACREFGDEWDDVQRALQGATYRFRAFTAWEGEARTVVEQNFEQQRQWIFSMVQMCGELRDQAWQLAEAHKKLRAPSGLAEMVDKIYVNPAEHPGPEDLQTCDRWYADGVQLNSGSLVWEATDWYAKMQVQSETSLKIFATNTSFRPLNPSMFPTASGVGAVVDGGNSRNLPDVPHLDGGTDMSAGTGMPSMPTMPTMPNMPTPSTDSAAAAQAAAAGAGRPKGPGMKPMSLGGGIGGGVPAMPAKAGLADWSSAPAQTSAAAAGPGRAVPAAYAALGAGGNGAGGAGGGMPMGGGQGKGEGSKGKRVQGGDDEALYTERRAWTEGIIGRRVKAPSDKEGVKKPAAYASLDAK
jgi:hypothetical protein